jgi:carbamoyl-phosphate synthase large subunit
VVAPALTLTDEDNQMLKEASLKIIRALGVEGGCNIQFALHPETQEYVVIEVNPRVSRSSALASKATGYPIARVAAKVAIGKTLDQIPNSVTKKTPSSFEPAIDYVVVKIPRWPFDKFRDADPRIGTQMKATGEVMAIGRTFEEALQKAVRSLDIGREGLQGTGEKDLEKIKNELKHPTDKRLFYIIDALECGMTIKEINELTKINTYFLEKIENILKNRGEIVI